jgi:hydroxyethylthiazole kinase-like uncharacterized protein yjeF
MKVVTPRQMVFIDKTAIEKYGIPGVVLMENAAAAVTDEAVKMLGEPRGKNVLIVAGKGNNGGDGFAVARHLFNRGAEVSVYVIPSMKEAAGDALTNLKIILNLGIKTYEIPENGDTDHFKKLTAHSDLVVDALFGTGLKGPVTGIAADIIAIINSIAKKVLSVDIPSGVDGETGACEGEAINADCTVTFCLPKIGLLIPPGCEKAGRLRVADISIPESAVNEAGISVETIEKDSVRQLLPARKKQSHKGDYGKALIISGSVGMTGSGCLAASAALKSGAGLVYLSVPSSLAAIYGSSVPEPVLLPMEDNGSGYMAENATDILDDILSGKDIIAAGPGLSTRTGSRKLIRKLLETAEQPLVLDADALNIIAEDKSILRSIRNMAAVTPHPGEMARLAGVSAEQVQKNRLSVARQFAAEWNVVTVLKGYRTLVACPDGTVYINMSGNPGMATAGSGDVLTGVIAGLAGQGMKLSQAAVAGVYLHGLAGDKAAEDLGEYGLTATDILNRIPWAIKHVMDA